MVFEKQQPNLSKGKSNSFSSSNWSASIGLPFVLGIAFLFGQPAWATPTWHSIAVVQESETDDKLNERIKSLISQLGDADFIVRNEAEDALAKIGAPATTHLREILTHKDDSATDSEIRLRAVRLLIIIEREVIQQNMRDFLKGKSDKIHYPGWPDFSKIAGSDSDARRLFITMFESNEELINKFYTAKTADELKRLESKFSSVATRYFRVNNYTNPTRLVPTLAAILFTSSQKREWNGETRRIEISEAEYAHLRNGIAHSRMVAAINNHSAKKILRRLIANWLNSIEDNSPVMAVVKMKVIDSYSLRENAELTLKLALDKTLPTSTRSLAVEILSRIANQKIVNDLKPLLSDKALVGKYLPIPSDNKDSTTKKTKQLLEVQMRDLALATTIVLRQKKLEDFGFLPTAYDGKKLIANQAGFFSDKDRTAALLKWESRDK